MSAENAHEKPYLVYTTTEEGHGGVYLWWKPKRSGYTRYIEEAGRYSLAEAQSIIRMRGQEGAVPLDIVLENASRVLQIGKLHEKLEPGLYGASNDRAFRDQTLREHGLGHHASSDS